MALSYSQVKAALDAAAAETGGKFVAFDASYYVTNYSVVRDANGAIIDNSLSNFTGDPLQHYVEQGAGKGYMPNPWFDAAFYRATYDDTTQLSGADLLTHYALHGVNEGRAPAASAANFNGERYLAENPDVVPYVEANLDTFGGSRSNGALAHLIKFGDAEGRAAYDFGGNQINLTPDPVSSAIAGVTDGDVTTVSLDTNGGNTTLTGSKVVIDGGDGISTLRLVGDADMRIDMTNSNNQVRGIDLDGDGTIAANGVENNISAAGIATFKNFEVVDAYARNPLNEGDAGNNFLGDIKYDGTGVDGDGVSTDGNIYLGGMGRDEALAGIGNDFLVGGGIAGQVAIGLPSGGGGAFFDYYDSLSSLYNIGDFLSGGRNADFMYGEFASLDNVDGVINIFDGGTTADDTSAGQNSYTWDYSSQDSDWILLEISDDEEFGEVVLDGWWQSFDGSFDEGPWPGEGPSEDFFYLDGVYGMDGWISVGDGKRLRGLLDDVENADASGNLYGFLDDYDVELGGRRLDDRDADGEANYGIGSSGQLRIFGSQESNKLIGGYDNDFINGGEGNDLLFGGNMQFFSETVAGGVTNPNLAGIWNDGRDELVGGDGDDDILFETDGGIYEGDSSYDSAEYWYGNSDTLWVTNYLFGTKTAGEMTTDGVVRIDLGSGTDVDDYYEPGSTPGDEDDNADGVALNFKGYGGADEESDTGTYTADQTNYVDGTARAQVQDFENVILTGLGDVDYKAAGGNSPELNFANQQNYFAYQGNADLRGTGADNILYANTGDDVLEGREGDDKLMGGTGNDDFIFSLDGGEGSWFVTSGDFCEGGEGRDFVNYVPYSGEGLDVIHRQQDLNGDNLWDTDEDGNVLYMRDFGLDQDAEVGESVLRIRIEKVGGNLPGDELVDVVNRVSEIRTGVKDNGEFTAIVLNTDAIKNATTYAGLEQAINDALDATAFGADLEAELQADGVTIYIRDAQGRELADEVSEVDAGVDVSQKANTQTENEFSYGAPEVIISQDRIIYKAYEDRTDNEGVDDDSILGSQISLGKDHYAEDLVVDFQADPSGTTGTTTYLSEDQAWTIQFANLTTEDKVTITINGVNFTLQVGKDLSGDIIDAENTTNNSQDGVQEAFLQRMASFITGQLDDDTAAGGLDVKYDYQTLTVVPRDYDAEEVVFIRKPSVAIQNLSGGEPASAKVGNGTQHELQLYQFDGRDNALNETNVLFWGQEEIQRANLETAKTAGGMLTGTDALVIDSGTDDLKDIPYNRTTDSDGYDFVVHGDDQFFGADGNDTIYGLTGDDRTYGSRGTDMIDGGKDLYKVMLVGATEATVEVMNDYEAGERDSDPNVASVELLLQVEAGGPEWDDRPTEGYFRDTLIFQQRDFGAVGAGGAKFTITMDDDLDRMNGGAGTVEVFEGAVKTGTTSFVEMENIRTVSGDGTWPGQGDDTLNVAALSTASEIYDTDKVKTNGGLTYYLTNDDDAGKIVINYTDEVYAKVDGVENVIFGNGDDTAVIDETEAGKDNLINGGLGVDDVEYDHDELCCDIRPIITFTVEAETNTDTVMMTGGILGLDEPTDTLISIEEVDAWDLANGEQLEDVLDVSNVSGAVVDFHGVDPILTSGKSDWSGSNVREDEASNSALVFIDGMSQFEIVAGSASGDTVIVADTMENFSCDDDDRISDIEFDSLMNYDQLNDDCERLTLGDIRAGNDDGNGEIPWAYNVETFEFNLAGGADRVDYSHETGFVVAVVNFNDADDDEGNPTHVLVKSGWDQGDVQWEWDHLGRDADLLDAPNDRVDLLRDTEEIVASQYDGAEGIGGVIDLTQSDRDIALTYSYGDEVTDATLDRVIRNVHLQDIATDTPINEVSFIEYHADDTNAANPNISQVSAFWTRVEGSDNDETVELTDFESQIDHEFNLRGGDNEVNYNELTKSINLYIQGITEGDEDDPLGTGLILAEAWATDGNGTETGSFDSISSYNSTNCISEGSLRIEASQDAEDSVIFEDDFAKYYTLIEDVDNSNEIIITRLDNEALTITLTGFEYLVDNWDTDDIYDMSADGALERAQDNLVLLDNPFDDDRDTIKVGDDAIGYDGGPNELETPNDTISLEVLNDIFGFDFDVLDVTEVTENDLMLVADDDDQDGDAIPNWADADYVGPADIDEDGDTEADRDTTTNPVDGEADDVIVGDLDLFDSVLGFQDIWLTDATATENGTEFNLNTILGELQDGSGDAFFTFDGRGINASKVTGADLTLTATSNTDVHLVGGAGDDSITGSAGNDRLVGGGGDDAMDGGLAAEVRQIELDGILDAAANAVTLTLDGFVLTVNEIAVPVDVDPTDENLDVTAGAGHNAVGAALASLVNANITDINDGVRFGGVNLLGATYVNDTLTFTFAPGADVLAGDTIVVADTDGGTFISSAESVVTNGGDGGDDTFVFGATAAANGFDTVTGFIAGAGGDILEFDAFLGAVNFDGVIGGTIGAGQNTDVAIKDNGGTAFTAATLAGLFVGEATGQRTVVIERDGTVAGEDAKLWYAHDADEDGSVETSEVTMVGVVVDGGDFAWVGSNF